MPDTTKNTDSKIAVTRQKASLVIASRRDFVAGNIGRLRELLRYLPRKKSELFQLIPFLLHVNAPRFAGYVASPANGFGIYRFHESGFYKHAQGKFNVTEKDLKPYLATNPVIDGLYLMGSSGTLAQSNYSDFDFWVVVDTQRAGDAGIERLNKKLRSIEKWAEEKFDQEVTFFVLGTDDVKNNRFPSIDDESSGSAQKSLLKEEFYRTFVMIAGKIPFWAISPAGLGDKEYYEWLELARNIDNINFYPEDYIDLGNLSSIKEEECLGAILWQFYKSSKDPAKSFIKSCLVIYYLFSGEDALLLCDLIKKRREDGVFEPVKTDPYAVVFEKAMEILTDMNDHDGEMLLRDCIYFRVCGNHLLPKAVLEGPKKELIDRYMNEWDWDEGKRDSIINYASSPESKKVAFDERVFKKLSFLYELALRDTGGDDHSFDMNEEDANVLKNRIAAIYQKKYQKLPRCSTYFKSSNVRKAITVACDVNQHGFQTWTAYDTSRSHNYSSFNQLFTGPELLRVVGWLVANGLTKSNGASVEFQTHGANVSLKRLNRLFDDVSSLKKSKISLNEALTDMPVLEKIIILINSDPRHREKTIQTADYLVNNTWREVFFDGIRFSNVDNDDVRCYKIAEAIWTFMSKNAGKPVEHKVLLIKDSASGMIENTIEGYLGEFKRNAGNEKTKNKKISSKKEVVRPDPDAGSQAAKLDHGEGQDSLDRPLLDKFDYAELIKNADNKVNDSDADSDIDLDIDIDDPGPTKPYLDLL